MKIFHLFVALFFLAAYVQAQEPTYFVEIGAYAEPVKMDYFKKISNVYETVDGNWIYRYRVDVANKTEGEQKVQEAKSVGFAYARLVDVEFSRACCSNQCGYVPPMRTNAKHMPMDNPKAKNDYDIVSGGRIIMDGKKKTKKGDIYTDANSPKVIDNSAVVDNTKPSKDKIIYRKDVQKTLDSLDNTKKTEKTADQNSNGAKPQADPKTTEETKPKKKRRQIYNKETGRMEDI